MANLISFDNFTRMFDEFVKGGNLKSEYLTFDGENSGTWVCDIYVDYNDDFSNIAKEAMIGKSIPEDITSVETEIQDSIYEIYEEYESDTYYNILNEFENYLSEQGIEYDEVELQEYIWDYVSFDYSSPLSSAMNTNIPVDVIINGEDLITYNKVKGGYSEGPGIENIEEIDKTSLANFLRLTGHTIQEFLDLLNTGYDSAHPTDLIESVVVDFNNCTFPAYLKFTILGGMTIKELSDKFHTKSPLVVKKDVVCGLWDFYQGSGGLFTELESDLEIPYGQFTIQPDSEGGIDSACGFVPEVWEGGLK